ncbi:MAG: hypothetical protein HY840_05125 [Bacteroidetes bacterium]|nr:hypothetical protein [Bacteroidota bacterium]
MSTNIWHYLENQFDNATKGSFKLMNTINADHFAKLQAQQSDPDIAALLARTTPAHDNYIDAYSVWFSARGIYKGETDRMENYVYELSSTKIKQWDAQIQMLYLEGTSDYIVILPNGRKPFNRGTMDDRISHLQSLADNLAAYPALAATMNDVIAFHTTLNDARDVQQQKEGLLNNASDLTETARRDIATMMYKNLGLLMDKYAANLNLVSNFWELSLLSSGSGAVAVPPPAPPPPATGIISITSDQSSISGMPLEIVISGNLSASGGTILATWESGVSNSANLTAGGTIVFQHVYPATGIKNITVTEVTAGVFGTISALQMPNVKAASITLGADLSSVTTFNFYGNNLSVSNVNDLLSQINAYGTSGGMLNISGGTMPVPDPAFPALIALRSRGWMVTTN